MGILRPNRLEEGESVRVRQDHIQENQVRRLPPELIEPLVGIRGADDLVRRLQNHLEGRPNSLFVIDQ